MAPLSLVLCAVLCASFVGHAVSLDAADVELDKVLAGDGTWKIVKGEQPEVTCSWKKGDKVYTASGSGYLTSGKSKHFHIQAAGTFRPVSPDRLPNIDYNGPCWGEGAFKHTGKHRAVTAVGTVSGNGWGPIRFRGAAGNLRPEKRHGQVKKLAKSAIPRALEK